MLLGGVRVLDVSRLLPGGYCTLLLQQHGAHVIKVESPSGDPIRGLPGGDAFFDALHRDKELLRLDLRTEDGRRIFGQRVAEADVVVEGFRPGAMERLQLGYEALAAINPALVYCAITGYGSAAKRADRAGHDLNYLAVSGALSLMPRLNGIPAILGLRGALGSVACRSRVRFPAITSTRCLTDSSLSPRSRRTSGRSSVGPSTEMTLLGGSSTHPRFPRCSPSWRRRRAPRGRSGLPAVTFASSRSSASRRASATEAASRPPQSALFSYRRS